MHVTYKCYYRHADSDKWKPYGGRDNPMEFTMEQFAREKQVQMHKYGYMGKPVADTMIVSIKRTRVPETDQIITEMELR